MMVAGIQEIAAPWHWIVVSVDQLYGAAAVAVNAAVAGFVGAGAALVLAVAATECAVEEMVLETLSVVHLSVAPETEHMAYRHPVPAALAHNGVLFVKRCEDHAVAHRPVCFLVDIP